MIEPSHGELPPQLRHSTVLPGDRMVARVRKLVLVVDTPAVGGSHSAIALAQAVDVDDAQLDAVLQAYTGPAFAVVQVQDAQVRVFLRGEPAAAPERAVTVAIFDHAASPAPTHVLHAGGELVQRVAPLAARSVVTVTVGPPPPPEPVCGPTALHLLHGSVPGAGVVVWSDASTEVPAAEPVTEALESEAKTNEEPTGVSPLFAATEFEMELPREVPSGPLVAGRRCAFDHLNAPHASYCARCGALVDRRAPIETGPRPPLGVLVVDDGTAFVVDADMVIGRDPAAYIASRTPSSGAGRLTPVALQDRTGALSRAHLELRLDGWQVLAIDVGSANGTWITPPGAPAPLRLPPGQPVPLAVGAELHLGGRILQLQDFASG